MLYILVPMFTTFHAMLEVLRSECNCVAFLLHCCSATLIKIEVVDVKESSAYCRFHIVSE